MTGMTNTRENLEYYVLYVLYYTTYYILVIFNMRAGAAAAKRMKQPAYSEPAIGWNQDGRLPGRLMCDKSTDKSHFAPKRRDDKYMISTISERKSVIKKKRQGRQIAAQQ